MKSKLVESIKLHEGWRNKAYQDSEGIWTIGYGRNLQELTINKSEGEAWLCADIAEAKALALRFPEYDSLDTHARKDVLVEMVFNMGPRRVAGFRNMLRAMRERDWDEAAMEMLDSKWADQVGKRAQRLSEQMRTGVHWNKD